MIIELIKNDIIIEDLSPEQSYGLRKIEYDLRVLKMNEDKRYERAKQNLQYHIQNIKNNGKN